MPANITVPFVEVTQHNKTFILTQLPADVLTRITYASIRGRDQEDGAVQRYLNVSRIAAIKEFTAGGGQYPNVIVLNWVNTDHPIVIGDGVVTIPDVIKSGQLIDGQHRVAGIKAAIEENPEISNLQIPVAIYIGLSTTDCANIFLAINTEQKPVPRSLVFDLYGIADSQIVDQAAVRARDIVMALNQDETSAYFNLIKLPGSPQKKGGIALSTAISAIKSMIEEKGDFEQIGISELEGQKQTLLNYFSVLKEKYGSEWETNSNAFMYASGFLGAIEFFRKKLIPYCNVQRSFQKATLSEAIRLESQDLILQEEVKGIGGKDAPKVIFERLNSFFHPSETARTIQF